MGITSLKLLRVEKYSMGLLHTLITLMEICRFSISLDTYIIV